MAINPEKNNSINSNLFQVIYSSSSVSWPSFRPLAYFSRNLADKFEMPKFAKGHNSGNIW